MKRYITKLNIVFIVQLFAVLTAVLGIFPREILLFSSSILVFFVLFSLLEESVLLIVRSIPIFTALPITEHFDSFNIWRLIVLIIFLQWIFQDKLILKFFIAIRNIIMHAQKGVLHAFLFAYTNWKIETLCTLLLFISTLSIIQADDPIIAIKRIIYFLNLGMLFFIVRASVNTMEKTRRIFINAIIGAIVVIVAGIVQLSMAYIMHIDRFAEFWALHFNKVLYGSAWANIVISANTWFAYYSNTIHLRMFASFPDTHSLPLYLLMIICFAVVVLKFKNIIWQKRLLMVIIFFAMAEIILSGTRGIWVSILFPFIFLGYIYYTKEIKKESIKQAIIPLVLFLFLLPISSVIFNSNQFTLSNISTTKSVFINRIKSIIDTTETSNQGRIYIWKKTLQSIKQHPFLGVGIGNFPTVLTQNPTAIKAGSSAHNLYLHFFAELGIFGFIIFMLIIYTILQKAWSLYTANNDTIFSFFGLNFLIYFIWILWYSMTDVAIFDERAFLLFMIFCGVLFALHKQYSQDKIFHN